MPEETPEQEKQVRRIVIDITDDSVKYDYNVTIPELLFWMDVVKSLEINKVTGSEA